MMQSTMTPTENKPITTGTKIKTFLRNLGPAVITVFSWLGAGDIINSAVSGANYGYALMWVLILSNLIRFVIVNTMTRFELMNKQGKSMVATFAEITKIFPLFLFVAALVMGNLTVGYILKGAAQSFGWLINVPQETVWAAVLAVITFLLLGRSLFSKLESIFKVFLAVLVSIFIILAIYCQPDVGQIAQGAFLFQIPKSEGAYGVMLVILGLVGATAGSLANLFHGINMSEGGVRDPKAMKGQTKSLLFSVIMGAVLVLCVWIIGADILRPNGIQVNSLQDIGKALEMYLGTAGSKIFYLGVFGALFSASASCAIGFTKLSIANLNELMPSRKGKYDKIQNDKIYPIFLAAMLGTAFIWSLPSMPSQVYLTIFVNALNVVIVPAIALGVLFVTNSKKYMGTHRNNWFENIVLVATTVLAIVSVVKTFL
ncbi:Nramp family divalent metal transporter [Lacticaseibacillus suihuaensis]